METDQNSVAETLSQYTLFAIAFTLPILLFLVFYPKGKYTGQRQRCKRPTTPVWRQPYMRSFNLECCPICLSPPSLALTTNCGHVFCGRCLRAVWQTAQNQGMSAVVRCPMCRGKVHEILPLNPEEVLYSRVMTPVSPHHHDGGFGGGSTSGGRYLTLYDFVVLFNETYQEPGSWCRTALCRCRDALAGASRRLHRLLFTLGYQNPTVGAVLSAVVPVLYVSHPQNLLGNTLPWGYVDDVLVTFLCFLPFVYYILGVIHPPQRS